MSTRGVGYSYKEHQHFHGDKCPFLISLVERIIEGEFIIDLVLAGPSRDQVQARPLQGELAEILDFVVAHCRVGDYPPQGELIHPGVDSIALLEEEIKGVWHGHELEGRGLSLVFILNSQNQLITGALLQGSLRDVVLHRSAVELFALCLVDLFLGGGEQCEVVRTTNLSLRDTHILAVKGVNAALKVDLLIALVGVLLGLQPQLEGVLHCALEAVEASGASARLAEGVARQTLVDVDEVARVALVQAEGVHWLVDQADLAPAEVEEAFAAGVVVALNTALIGEIKAVMATVVALIADWFRVDLQVASVTDAFRRCWVS